MAAGGIGVVTRETDRRTGGGKGVCILDLDMVFRSVSFRLSNQATFFFSPIVLGSVLVRVIHARVCVVCVCDSSVVCLNFGIPNEVPFDMRPDISKGFQYSGMWLFPSHILPVMNSIATDVLQMTVMIHTFYHSTSARMVI